MLSLGMQVAGAVTSGMQQRDYMNYQARQAEADARVQRELGDLEAEKTRKAGAKTRSAAKAALAASGVDVSAGTPIEISQSIESDAEYDAKIAVLNGGYAANKLESKAQADRITGRNAFSSSLLSAAGTAVRGGWIMSEGTQKPAPVEERTVTPYKAGWR